MRWIGKASSYHQWLEAVLSAEAQAAGQAADASELQCLLEPDKPLKQILSTNGVEAEADHRCQGTIRQLPQGRLRIGYFS